MALRIVEREPAALRPHAVAGSKQRPAGGIGVAQPQGPVDQEDRARDIVEHLVCEQELSRHAFELEANANRTAEMAGEAADRREIRLLKLSLRRSAKRHDHRGGLALEQRRMGHDGAKILRLEPVGEQFRAGEGLLPHHHLVAHRPAAAPDLLPDPISRREPPIGMVEVGIDAVRAEVAESVRPHVLHAEANAGGVGKAAYPGERKVPLRVVRNSFVDKANQIVVFVNHI